MFALVNAGVPLGQAPFTAISSQVSLGIIGGLVIGKQVGIILFSWLSVRMRIADLPDGTTWARIYAVGILGGIGFTMSIFIANLAFADAATIDSAKLGILGASVVAGLTGWAVLRRTVR
jgi:NhaA family Na+:H+ antiporter